MRDTHLVYGIPVPCSPYEMVLVFADDKAAIARLIKSINCRRSIAEVSSILYSTLYYNGNNLLSYTKAMGQLEINVYLCAL